MAHRAPLSVWAFSVVCVAITAGCSPTQTSDGPAGAAEVGITEIDDSPQGVDLGFGWRTNEAVPAPSKCVEFTESRASTAQKTSFTISEVVDKASLLETLNLSTSLSWKGLIASAEGKGSFARTVEMSSDSSHFSLVGRVGNPVRFAGPVAETVDGRLTGAIKVDLIPRYRDLAERDIAQFQRECGDSYVHAAYDGAELSAVLSFLHTTLSEREELSTSVAGSYLRFEASGSYNTMLQRYQDNKRLNLQYQMAGGSGQPVPTDKTQLVANAERLATLAKSDPTIFKFGVVSYTNLPGWPRGTQLPASDWHPDLVTRQFGRLRTVFEETSLVLSGPGQWILDRGVTEAEVRTLRDELQLRLKSIAATGEDCKRRGSTKCDLKGEDATPDYAYRARMPLRHSSFEFESAIAAKEAALRDLRQQLAAIQAVKEYGSLNELVSATAKIARLNRQVPEAEKELQDMNAAYPSKLQDAVFAFWLRYPARVRCKAAPTTDCPSEQDLQAFAKAIVTK